MEMKVYSSIRHWERPIQYLSVNKCSLFWDTKKKEKKTVVMVSAIVSQVESTCPSIFGVHVPDVGTSLIMQKKNVLLRVPSVTINSIGFLRPSLW